MTNELVTITFKADQGDIDGAVTVFQEYGLTLEEGVILFLRHVAETRTLPDFIEEHLRRREKTYKNDSIFYAQSGSKQPFSGRCK
jgi:antitoxin component of RelBE/YafQ-DinJ toxin-antitoxin module